MVLLIDIHKDPLVGSFAGCCVISSLICCCLFENSDNSSTDKDYANTCSSREVDTDIDGVAALSPGAGDDIDGAAAVNSGVGDAVGE